MEKGAQSNLGNAVIGIMGVILVSRFLGFVREILIGYQFGTSFKADALITAITIPTIFVLIIVRVVGTAFIPMYTSVNVDDGKESSNRFTSHVISVLLVVSLIIVLLGIFLIDMICSVFAKGFDPETLLLTRTLMLIMFPSVLFLAVSSILSSYLESNNRFVIPKMVGIPNNLILIIFLVLSGIFGITGVAVAFLMGAISQLVIQIYFVRKVGLKFHFHINLRDKNMRRFGQIIAPILLGVTIQEFNPFVDRILASRLPEGSIAILNYGFKLNLFIFGIISLAIGSVIFPGLSKLYKQGKEHLIKEKIPFYFNTMTIAILPLMSITILLSSPIVSLLFEHGKFGAEDSLLTAGVFTCYAFGMMFFSYQFVMIKVFYALQDNQTPMRNVIIEVVLNIAISISLIQILGIYGLAIGTSLSILISFLLLISSLKKRLGSFINKQLLLNLCKCLISSLFAGTQAKVGFMFLTHLFQASNFFTNLGYLVISFSVGGSVYILLIFILKVDGFKLLVNILRREKGGGT